MTDYETMVFRSKEKTIKTYCREIETSYYEEDILKKGISAIQNTRITLEYFDFDCKLLLKRKGKSSLGQFYYEPCIFLGTNKISKENRMELTFLCILLEKIQGNFPDKALFINKKCYQYSLKLAKLKNEVETAISNIRDFKENPPKLVLNKHCSHCSFQSLCKEQALSDDNLSLLDRITLKQLLKLEKKGIFTLTQLSYIYKPRRKVNVIKIWHLPINQNYRLWQLEQRKHTFKNCQPLREKPLNFF